MNDHQTQGSSTRVSGEWVAGRRAAAERRADPATTSTFDTALEDVPAEDVPAPVTLPKYGKAVTAFHEAGHAVAAVFLGHTLLSVDIICREHEWAEGYCLWDQRGEGDWFEEQSAMVCTEAGRIGMQFAPIYRPEDDSGSRDDQRHSRESAEIIHEHVWDDDRREVVMGDTVASAISTAESILFSPCGRAAVYSLAAALLEKKVLTGEEATKVIRQAGKFQPPYYD